MVAMVEETYCWCVNLKHAPKNDDWMKTTFHAFDWRWHSEYRCYVVYKADAGRDLTALLAKTIELLRLQERKAQEVCPYCQSKNFDRLNTDGHCCCQHCGEFFYSPNV